jgi:nicotinate-nucleotide--dimethylbenzimidazole phosphoribosyltransferase
VVAVQPTADPALADDGTAQTGEAGAAPGEDPAAAEVVRATASVEVERPEFLPGIAVPQPDDAAILAAWERLSSIDIGVNAPTISGLGTLAESVAFIAGVQAHPYPRPILSTRVVLVTGNHAGGLVAGSAPDPRHSVPLQQLASAAGASFVSLEWNPAANAIELEDAITSKQLDAAMRMGWAEAERAADEGIELLVLAAGGAGASAAAVAVVSAISGYETSALLGRVVTPAGVYDDNAWMTRAIALRDAMHRVRHRDGDPRTVLCALGGADLAGATGLLLGAASRRLPVMIDGPVGAAAAMLANDFAPSIRRWLMMPDHGRNVSVIVAAESLELKPWLDLCLDLGEGATSLSALPLLQMALTLAGAGAPVEPQPLTRFDPSTGAQVFVGSAQVDQVEPVEEAEESPVPSAALTAPTTSIGAKAKSRPAPPKPTPAKSAAPKAAKAAAAKAKGTSRTAGGRTGATKTTGSKATPAKAAPKAAGASGDNPAVKADATVPATTPAPAASPEPQAPPEQRAAEPSVVGTAMGDGAAPEAQASPPGDPSPTTATPPATVSDAKASDAKASDAKASDAATPDATAAKATTPDVTAPDATTPAATASEATAPSPSQSPAPVDGTSTSAPRPRKRP